MERYPLLLGENRIGEITVRRGVTCELCAQCALLSDGLYRAYLRTREGETLLGVLEPCSGVLQAKKRLSGAALEALGEIRDGQARRSFSFAAGQWARIPDAPLFADAALARRVAANRDGRYYRDGRGVHLAFPCAPDRPFPIEELFCFARICTVEGRLCATYCLDERGFPIF